MNEWMSEWMNEWMNEKWTNEWIQLTWEREREINKLFKQGCCLKRLKLEEILYNE